MKLQPLLNQYLVEYGQLPLPGIGQLSIEQQPAVVQAIGSGIEPPHITIALSAAPPSDQDLQQLSNYVGHHLSVSSESAVQLLLKEADITRAATPSGLINWPPFGRFLKTEEEGIAFQQGASFAAYLPAVPLQQLQKEEPAVVQEIVVSDTGGATADEPVYAPAEPPRSDAWWVWALVIFAISVLLITYRFLG